MKVIGQQRGKSDTFYEFIRFQPVIEMSYIIFTDLDGTLLDHDTYDHSEANEALDCVKERRIPIIICSSKTRSEIEYYRRVLRLQDPFIVENGAAVFIPKDTLDFGEMVFAEFGDYQVIELGAPYAKIKDAFAAIREETGCRLLGFSEMSPDQAAELTGLSSEMAALALQRDYSEPFLLLEQDSRLSDLVHAAEKRGLRIVKGGRFYHLIGDSDKGKAVQTVTGLYASTGYHPASIGLGDSPNDFPMLGNVDIPVLVKKKSGRYALWPAEKKVVLAPGVGPKGWNQAVLTLLRKES